MNFVIVTNNPLVYDKYTKEKERGMEIDYEDISYREILCKVRDMVHAGHKLLTHPLSGSVKPNETPYKTVLVGLDKGNMDLQDMNIIENAIITADKFKERFPNMNDRIRYDFQTIDCVLATSGVDAVLRR